ELFIGYLLPGRLGFGNAHWRHPVRVFATGGRHARTTECNRPSVRRSGLRSGEAADRPGALCSESVNLPAERRRQQAAIGVRSWMRSVERSAGCFLMLLASVGLGQEFRAGISGEVRDPSGQTVAGAKVVAACVERNVSYEFTTNSAGRYNIQM